MRFPSGGTQPHSQYGRGPCGWKGSGTGANDEDALPLRQPGNLAMRYAPSIRSRQALPSIRTHCLAVLVTGGIAGYRSRELSPLLGADHRWRAIPTDAS